MSERNEAIKQYFEENPGCTTPSECDKEIAEEFGCSEQAAQSARYRVFKKKDARPWNKAKLQEMRVEGQEKAVPTGTRSVGPGKPRLIFGDGYPKTQLPHHCPHYNVVADSLEEVDELFGWRKIGEYDDGTPKYIVQSWCREARAEEVKNSNK